MTPAAFRKLALSFPEASEGAHGGHPDFRVGGKLFASLGYPDKTCATILLSPEEQDAFTQEDPDAFERVGGYWGSKGATTVHLKAAKTAPVKSALHAAWRRKAPKSLAAKLDEAKPARR